MDWLFLTSEGKPHPTIRCGVQGCEAGAVALAPAGLALCQAHYEQVQGSPEVLVTLLALGGVLEEPQATATKVGRRNGGGRSTRQKQAPAEPVPSPAAPGRDADGAEAAAMMKWDFRKHLKREVEEELEGLKALGDMVEYRRRAREVMEALLEAVIEEDGPIPVTTAAADLSYLFGLSLQTVKRYLKSMTSRYGKFRLVGKDIDLRLSSFQGG